MFVDFSLHCVDAVKRRFLVNEALCCAAGADVALTESPLEAGLGFACKLKDSQSDFEGKAAIVAQKQAGVHKRLVSVSARDNSREFSLFGHEQELLYRDGELVGALTSGAYSHTLDRAIGLGYVHRDTKMTNKWLNEGKYEVEVTTRDGHSNVGVQRFPVDVSLKCLVDPVGERVRGA